MQQMELSFARSTDPETSHAGGSDVRIRSGSQRAVLLSAYADGKGLTATEAALKAHVSLESCYWKRCSELRQAGYIQTLTDSDGSSVTRKNPRSGSWQEVNVITPKGLSWLESNNE